ncbi:hypothetical protein IAE49_04015 [Kosakonia sp. S58]|uniref:hypothetical protein n=1 Tax=unclassified Kosakonia TaxID=2632876 RepID=UPI0019054E1E|nr:MULTISPECIES: hypothetical protein [unclassified Kosakonia]MBK0078692.1 hypothetical protein [Kosakonia sp. S57]MBK0085401.1 hypothetical protein [Kosakonia sp. S58]
MLIRNMLLKYYAPEDDGQGGAGGGTEITPEIQKLIDDQVAAQVSGLKTKNSELLGTIKQQKDNLSRFDGIDPDAVRGILQRFSDDEEAKLIAAGKIDEVLDKRTERLRADVDKQIKAANERADKAEAFSGKFRDRVLGDAIRSAASKAGALAEASDDLILRAKGTFQLNDEGEAVAVDANGDVLFGKDGKTPLSPLEWAESLKETAPHLFPRAEGTGAGGHKPGGGGSQKRSEMSASDKADYIRKHGQQAFLKLPK